jgi:predicted RNA-binding Zn ribbon-like protein
MTSEPRLSEELPQLPFIFLGGNLAIDLVDTERNRRVPGSKEIIRFDQLWDQVQAEAWWREVCRRYTFEGSETYRWNSDDFRTLLALRSELRAFFESIIAGASGPGPVPVLNSILARGSYVVSASAEGPRRDYISREGRIDPLLTIALAAAELFAKRDLSRLRRCRSERCVLLFYDGTKSGTRHWCGQGCMNRARARANYRKAKEGGGRAVESLDRQGFEKGVPRIDGL